MPPAYDDLDQLASDVTLALRLAKRISSALPRLGGPDIRYHAFADNLLTVQRWVDARLAAET